MERIISAVSVAFFASLTGCAGGPPLRPAVPVGEVHVQVRTTNLAGPLEEDEERENAPRRVEVVMGGSQGSLRSVHQTEVGGACESSTEGLELIGALLAVRCPDQEFMVVRTRSALVVRGRNGDARWHDLASQRITPTARVVASSE